MALRRAGSETAGTEGEPTKNLFTGGGGTPGSWGGVEQASGGIRALGREADGRAARGAPVAPSRRGPALV